MSLGYDALVQALQRETHIDRARAEAIVRANLRARGEPVPHDERDPATVERDARVLEKAEQTEIVKLFRAHGFKVYSLSQARAAKQTPGLPDLWVTKSWEITQNSGGRIYGDGAKSTRHVAFWWESKRQVGGVLSTAQQEFRDECLAAGVAHCVGDRYAARDYLTSLGIRVEP